MKKYLFIFLFFFSGHSALCQDVIINGTNKNRPLTWDDFTGKPDKTSSYAANTYWNLNYYYRKVVFNADTARVIDPVVKLELNKELSWVKPGMETPGLLKHEQGHFDIGLLCQKEFIEQLKNTIFTRTDFRDKVQAVFKTILDKYMAMGIKYDEETDHGKKKDNQEKWNDLLAIELIKQ